MDLNLEIEELVVHGVSSTERERLVAVIERRLEALVLAGRGAVGGSLDVPGGVFEMPAGLGVDEIGRRVAESIWKTCRGTGRPRETGTGPVADPPPAGWPGRGVEREGS